MSSKAICKDIPARRLNILTAKNPLSGGMPGGFL
jgi:hypothetical protein